MNKRHYEHTLPNIRGSLSNTYCGKNFIGKEYKDYIRHIAFEEMGLKPGIVSHYRNGVLYKNGTIPEL